jgi:hypothetical protein
MITHGLGRPCQTDVSQDQNGSEDDTDDENAAKTSIDRFAYVVDVVIVARVTTPSLLKGTFQKRLIMSVLFHHPTLNSETRYRQAAAG